MFDLGLYKQICKIVLIISVTYKNMRHVSADLPKSHLQLNINQTQLNATHSTNETRKCM